MEGENMGDGRYYTFFQFSNVVIFTALIIFVLINFMLGLYKLEKHKKLALTLGVFLLSSLIFSFMKEIVYSMKFSNQLSLLSHISLIGHIGIVLIFYFFYVFYKKEKVRFFLIASAIFFLSIVLWIVAKIPIKVVYALLSLHLYILYNALPKYKISSQLFSDVKNQLLDFVFITQVDGSIIFKSDKVIQSSFFRKTQKINSDELSTLLTGTIMIRHAFGKHFIKMVGDDSVFFQYNKKDIYNKGRHVGIIWTFTDITTLINLLDELKEKQQEMKESNLRLMKYKEQVYEVEREKEIHALLEEIANNQQKSMMNLKCEIVKLDIDNPEFSVKIDKLIKEAKFSLAEVRKAVSTYMSHYE